MGREFASEGGQHREYPNLGSDARHLQNALDMKIKGVLIGIGEQEVRTERQVETVGGKGQRGKFSNYVASLLLAFRKVVQKQLHCAFPHLPQLLRRPVVIPEEVVSVRFVERLHARICLVDS